MSLLRSRRKTMIDVLFNRLIDMAGIDIKEIWEWPDAPPILIEEVISEK